jgi:serine/threonine protein kinase
MSFKDVIDMTCQCHEFDILKFFVQIGKYLEACKTLDIKLLQLDENSVIMDRDGNFQLANLNSNVSITSKDENNSAFLKDLTSYILNQKRDSPLAPEVVQSKQITQKSMIWDMGVLALRSFIGSSVKIDYNKGTIDLSYAKSLVKTKSQNAIFNIIKGCLSYDAGSRISVKEVIQAASESLNEISGFLNTFNTSLLKDVIREHNSEIKDIISDLGNLVTNQTFRRDTTLNDFIYEKVIYKNKEMSVKKILKILLQPSELMYDNMLRDLVKQSWDMPITIVKVYNFIKSRIDEIVQSEIKTMKLLLILHTFIFKGSQNTLIVFLKDSNEQNSVNLILETVMKAYANRKQSLIFRYTYFLYIKFNLQLKLIKILQNNFSVTKNNLIYNFEKLLTPEVFKDLFDFLKLTFTLFLSLRKFSFDYYYRSFIVAFFKELTAILGLLSNMTIYLLFGITVLSKNGSASNSQINDLEKQMMHFLETFDFMAMVLNIYVEQARRLKYESFRYFKIKKNLPETFEIIRMKMQKSISTDESTKSSRFFTKNFMNDLLKMGDCVGDNEEPPSMREIQNLDTKVIFGRIIPKFLDKSEIFKKLILNVGYLVPKARRWYEQNVKLITGGMQSNRQDMSTNMLTAALINNPDNSHKPSKSIETQTEPVTLPRNPKETTKEQLERDKKKVNQKMKLAEKGVDKKNNTDKNEGDIIINGLNVNEFILSEFKRSLDAWIISFGELKFEELIASGSTCTVHKGIYKNMKVAIKKLLTPNSKDSVKFMKEFKRELSLLISLPHHPNLLTLIGFCIKDNNIYLVTEFCEGGTLFDILYRKHIDRKLTFRQKIKILLDVARGMQFLHDLKRQIIHRDLKSLNILIDKKIKDDSLDFQAKIADFGLARSFDNPTDFVTKRMGTFHWMAPEIFSDKPYNSKTDMYAFAIIVWEIFAEKTPYYHLDSPTKIIKYVYYDNGRPHIDDCGFDERFKKDIVELIKKNWDKSSGNRQEFDEVYKVLNRVLQNI